MIDVTQAPEANVHERLLELLAKLAATRIREEQSRKSLDRRQAAVVEMQGFVDALQRRIRELVAQIEALEQTKRIIDGP